MKTKKIPTFAADGKRLRAYSPDAIERLLSLSLVVVIRNRKGRILRAHFRPTDGANPLRASCNMGQRYYFLEHVGDHKVYSHTPLIAAEDAAELNGQTPEELDRYIRNIFRAVPLSVMQQRVAPTPTPKAKVVDIGEYRKRTRTAQGVKRAA